MKTYQKGVIGCNFVRVNNCDWFFCDGLFGLEDGAYPSEINLNSQPCYKI